MKQATIVINERSSVITDFSNVILSVRTTYGNHCEVVVGCPGLQNVVKDMKIGDAVLYETPTDGILEVRVLKMDTSKVALLISQVSPRPGIIGGFIDEDPSNAPFSSDKLKQIASSIADIKEELRKRNDIKAEQLELISRKLDEIQAASNRLGRKDWIIYVGGTLTNLCISAAFSPEVSKAIFRAVNSAFLWLFEKALKFIV
jgi:hypothetical protein